MAARPRADAGAGGLFRCRPIAARSDEAEPCLPKMTEWRRNLNWAALSASETERGSDRGANGLPHVLFRAESSLSS